ncbi:hypothetical protein COB11_00955 [Candidatus Aerophobetes bacterium]|uniref:Uncharacterized protein n=1 Tax=Aerophobetes bacterium TaxID=2030807 RepID=A0A2A4YM08_UNCAE|nr:MAG: hypothetical protein COB11_00955 [Candidatus Aerophobetes bacterium]
MKKKTNPNDQTIKLVELNSLGILAGPCESEKDFIKRVNKLKHFSISVEELQEKVGSDLHKFEEMYERDLDLKIDWLFEKKKKNWLNILQPACTWIYHFDDIHYPILEFKGLNELLNRREILRHEMIHASRSSFNEPVFEEFIAYSTSDLKWRSFFGPIFRHSYELYGFALLSLVLAIPQCCLWTTIAYLGLCSALFARLIYNQKVFKGALKKIQSMFDVVSPLSVAIRLTDSEIRLFSRVENSAIFKYIERQSSLRWQQIINSYSLNSTRYF